MLFWRYLKDYLLSYTYKNNQVFLVSFPKTGRTWLSYMLDQIEDKSDKKINYLKTHDFSEIVIESGQKQNPSLIFKYVKRYFYRRAKVIFLVRDPRDVIVSHFHQITKRTKKPMYFSSISEFVRDETFGFNRIIQFYNIWYNQRKISKDFFLVKYEDLKNNGENELKKIFNFLEFNIDEKIIREVYNKSSATKMRNKELVNKLSGFNDFGKEINHLKVRKAKVGSYLDELSQSDIDYCNYLLKNLQGFKYYK